MTDIGRTALRKLIADAIARRENHTRLAIAYGLRPCSTDWDTWPEALRALLDEVEAIEPVLRAVARMSTGAEGEPVFESPANRTIAAWRSLPAAIRRCYEVDRG